MCAVVVNPHSILVQCRCYSFSLNDVKLDIEKLNHFPKIPAVDLNLGCVTCLVVLTLPPHTCTSVCFCYFISRCLQTGSVGTGADEIHGRKKVLG